MFKVNFTPNILHHNTSNDNVQPNPNLAQPSIIPPYIAKDQDEVTIFVLIAPYPDMQVGDVIIVNIDGGITPGYKITDTDIGNQINIQLTKDTLSNVIIGDPQQSLISYTIDSDKYPINNTSPASYLKVTDQSLKNLGNISIKNNIIGTSKFDCIGNHNNIISNDTPVGTHGENDIYFIMMVENSNEFYYDRIDSVKYGICFLLILADLKWALEFAGSNLKIWATAISNELEISTVHLSSVSTVKIPGLLESNPPTISEFSISHNTYYEPASSTYIYIGNDFVSGDSILLNNSTFSDYNNLLIISDNFSYKNIAIPYFGADEASDIFKNSTTISYTAYKEKYIVQSGTTTIFC